MTIIVIFRIIYQQTQLVYPTLHTIADILNCHIFEK